VGDIRTSEEKLARGGGETSWRQKRGWPEVEKSQAGGRREAGRSRKGPLKFSRDEGIAWSSETSRMSPRTGRQDH